MLPETPDSALRCEIVEGATLSAFDKRELSKLKPVEWTLDLGRRTNEAGEIIESRLVKSEIFDYANPNEQLRFYVRQIKDALVAGTLDFRIYRAKLNAHWYQSMVDHSGIEHEHLARIPARALQVPPIGALFPDSSLRFIDGNHRIVRRWQLGNPFLRFIVVQLNALHRAGLVVPLSREECAVTPPITAPSSEAV